ncbi:GNAT family N-acetyltransferase [Colwellia maritima]|uniref:GNAT family N-acetyltransferase n=1 Tax=Colwellia maritima TaxID=2912588 RepID=UPI00308463BA
MSDKHAELKSMRTSQKFLRKGVAAKLLTHMLDEAKKQAFEQVSLETGTVKAFIPAQELYKRFGFVECLPFSDYQEDPFSMFFTKHITSS